MLPQNKRPSRLPPAPPAAASHRPPLVRRTKQSVVPPAPAPSAAARPAPRDPAPTFQDEDEMTMLRPSLPRGVLAGAQPPELQASRPLMALNLPQIGELDPEDDDEATRMFDSGRVTGRGAARPEPQPVPYAEPTMLAAGQAKKNTLARNSSAVEDDIQARARLAFETGENPALRAQPSHLPPQLPPQHAQHGYHPGHPVPMHVTGPAPAFVDPSSAPVVGSRRPVRSATSTASAFQRTEAEIPPAFAPSARPVPRTAMAPLPGAPSSLPAASWTASGEQVVLPAPARRGAASWFMALGVAAVVVAAGSAVLLRNPGTALAASALADPQTAAAAPTAELPTAEAVASASAPPIASAAAAPAAPPPQYVPGTLPAAAPEPVAVAPVMPAEAPAAVPDADEAPAKPAKHSSTTSHASTSHASTSHAPTPSKPQPAPAPKAATAPTPVKPPKAEPPPKADPPPKKGKKGEQTDEERKASEEAARLARKQLDDQL